MQSSPVVQLDQTDSPIARQIYTILRQAYLVEARLVGIEKFPPLERTLSQIEESPSIFFGYRYHATLVAIAEVEVEEAGSINIASLAVDPAYFRRSFGSRLLTGVLGCLPWQRVTVSTAEANHPAIHLYKKLGFQLLSRWQTPEAISMFTFYQNNVIDFGQDR